MPPDPIVRAEPTDIDAAVLARAQAVAAPLVVLPVRHANGQGVYTQTSVLLVKKLRAAGLSAEFLDPPESRTFEVKKSVFTEVIVSIALNIGGSAAWDAIKAVFRSRSAGEQPKLSVTYVDLDSKDGERGKAWKVEGDSDAVLQAIDKLRQNVPAGSPAEVEAVSAPSGEVTGSFPTAGPDDDLHAADLDEQISRRRAAAQSLLRDARGAVEGPVAAQSLDNAEKDARAALTLFARSLDWAEDTEEEDEAHRLMDQAGAWVRETFGCQLTRSETQYSQTCPVALAHNRIGMSIGGTAKRLCSLCGGDLSECEHIPGTSYLVPGGVSPLGWCRVCLQEACEHTPDQNHRVPVVGIIKEMDLVEVSFVPKPAQPEARIMEMSIPVSELVEALGDEFIPGDEVSCDACLLQCRGLTKHDPENSGKS
jgi:hypothetical protein